MLANLDGVLVGEEVDDLERVRDDADGEVAAAGGVVPESSGAEDLDHAGVGCVPIPIFGKRD